MLIENNSVPFDKRVWKEIRTLKRIGLSVITISPQSKEDFPLFEQLEGVRIYRYKVNFASSKLGYIFEYLISLLRMIQLSLIIFLKEGFHIIHVANPPDLLWIVALFYRLLGVKFVYDQHDLVPETYLSKFDMEKKTIIYQFLILLENISYKLAHVVIVTNESYKKNAIERGNISSRKVFIVRNGPYLKEFQYSKPVNKWKFGHKYMCAYLGIMGSQDGVDYVIKAADILINERNNTDIAFVLIGKGEELEHLKHMTRESNLQKHVFFTGRIPDKPVTEILSTADICLSPDPLNPLNDFSTMNKIMEYMSCKSPIVSFKLKEAKYSAEDAAIYVENYDSYSFAEGILKLLNKPQLRNKMANIGYERVVNYLSWENQEIYLKNAYEYIVCN